MKKILFFLTILISFNCMGQFPPGYVGINARYQWMAGIFGDGLTMPGYTGYPGQKVGVAARDGQLAMDTVSGKVYKKWNGVWYALADSSTVAANNAKFVNLGAGFRSFLPQTPGFRTVTATNLLLDTITTGELRITGGFGVTGADKVAVATRSFDMATFGMSIDNAASILIRGRGTPWGTKTQFFQFSSTGVPQTRLRAQTSLNAAAFAQISLVQNDEYRPQIQLFVADTSINGTTLALRGDTILMSIDVSTVGNRSHYLVENMSLVGVDTTSNKVMVLNPSTNEWRYMYWPSTGGGSSYTFSTGLTNTAGTVTNNLSTGVSGGQTLVGSTGTTSGITYKATTGVGTTGADHIFTVGNNGATEAMRIKNSGEVYMGTTSDAGAYTLQVANPVYFETTGIASGFVMNNTTNDYNQFTFQQAGTNRAAQGHGGTNSIPPYLGSFYTQLYTGTSRWSIINSGNIQVAEITQAGAFNFAGALMPNNTAGTAGQTLNSAGAGASPTWGSAGLVIGSSAITGSSPGRILYDSAGFVSSNASFIWDVTNKRLGIGVAAPTARLHLQAGTATTSTGPLKFTAGIRLTTPESGVIETDSDNNLYYTNNVGTRGVVQVSKAILSNTGTATVTLNYSDWVFTGTTATWTLPAVAGSENYKFFVKNRGSGNLTINSSGGGNDIYSTSAVNTYIVAAGSSIILMNDGTYWLVE